jgi:hypothetical protein
MSVNIGDTISYSNQYEEVVSGKITEVFSDMDSYEDMELHDGVAYYASKKLTMSENKKRKLKGLSPLSKPVFVPVKEKNKESVFLSVKNDKGESDFIFLEEIHGV